MSGLRASATLFRLTAVTRNIFVAGLRGFGLTLSALSWLAVAAYSFHILEEYQLNWRDWARKALRLQVEWSDFYVTNAIVVVVGIVQAMLAPELPLAALSFSALMVINASFFHILPFVMMRRFSPGLITATTLLLPSALATFRHYLSSGQANPSTLFFAFIIGALTMVYPIFLLRVRSRPFFNQAP